MIALLIKFRYCGIYAGDRLYIMNFVQVVGQKLKFWVGAKMWYFPRYVFKKTFHKSCYLVQELKRLFAVVSWYTTLFKGSHVYWEAHSDSHNSVHSDMFLFLVSVGYSMPPVILKCKFRIFKPILFDRIINISTTFT